MLAKRAAPCTKQRRNRIAPPPSWITVASSPLRRCRFTGTFATLRRRRILRLTSRNEGAANGSRHAQQRERRCCRSWIHAQSNTPSRVLRASLGHRPRSRRMRRVVERPTGRSRSLPRPPKVSMVFVDGGQHLDESVIGVLEPSPAEELLTLGQHCDGVGRFVRVHSNDHLIMHDTFSLPRFPMLWRRGRAMPLRAIRPLFSHRPRQRSRSQAVCEPHPNTARVGSRLTSEPSRTPTQRLALPPDHRQL